MTVKIRIDEATGAKGNSPRRLRLGLGVRFGVGLHVQEGTVLVRNKGATSSSGIRVTEDNVMQGGGKRHAKVCPTRPMTHDTFRSNI